jgi:Tol biopolymer transport system component
MSELTPLREAVDTLAARSSSPDFAEIKRRTTRRRRRRVAVAVVAAAVVVGGSAVVAVGFDDDRRTAPVQQPEPSPSRAVNGWVAVDGLGGDIHLVRPGEDARPLETAGSGAADDACPVWSPDGTRLLFGRLTGSPDSTSREAELVVVPVDGDGATGDPAVITLDGFDVLSGFDPHPCATWAPDGRSAALAGTGEVWIVDTVTGAVRRLPDQRPVDLEWRPGTDQLAMAGDLGTDRAMESRSTPVTVYSMSTGEVRQLGSGNAETITWSPDGSTLAYRTGDDGGPGSLWLVDADGSDERMLVADAGSAIHGVGPVWSPTGESIAYQRQLGCCESHEVVLVGVGNGTETVVETPSGWQPFHVTWSPDGTTLLYTAWNQEVNGGRAARILVPVDSPGDVTVLTDFGGATDYVAHRGVFAQAWGRRPG